MRIRIRLRIPNTDKKGDVIAGGGSELEPNKTTERDTGASSILYIPRLRTFIHPLLCEAGMNMVDK